MKCEKCNQNEANVYYQASINGHTTEQHLCTHCAEEQGLNEAFLWPGRELMEEAFTGFFGRDPLESFFTRSMLPGYGHRAAPGRTMLRSASRRVEPQVKEPVEADPELDKRRRCNALRAQIEAAVKAEDYEKAIELRDELRKLEK